MKIVEKLEEPSVVERGCPIRSKKVIINTILALENTYPKKTVIPGI